MRKSFLLVVIVTSLLTSCQKEISEEIVPAPPPTTDTTNTPGGDTTSNLPCKECLYMPLCDKSWFTYVDSVSGAPEKESTTNFNLVKDTSIQGLKYNVYKDAAGNQSYYHCSGGVVKAFSIAPVTTPTGTIMVTTIITPLKYEEAVGGTWKDEIEVKSPPPALSTFNTYNYTMISKNGTLVVKSKTYTDVIKVKQETVSVYDGIEMSTITQYYYYAKGVGLIKSEMESEDFFGNTTVFYRMLKEYKIP
jgi:hypothetical protein